jgi:hypothetical protein
MEVGSAGIGDIAVAAAGVDAAGGGFGEGLQAASPINDTASPTIRWSLIAFMGGL